ncbi:hypothetical protein [Mycobacteroides abscessus]|uniref:hypothetical protein n=1 Tax=Mycobacteroides abscessus TaxID=36809 RepID=UPI00078CAC15|nr:hypothetical protein [Mycobacteroides abscessus]AMU27708.1 hypothetical protein A3N96_21785 [Mycobacteroides abscessus]MDO3363951.1 hypothetical protein [Mycobacteroides abscessus subsp. massiliense]QSM73999.1 hypothetical protein I2T84_21935 [Mycobacteroides abscessus subsp. massiliense]SKI16781.1 Uncharacterised protein [Mycobacteroides abscessus subsp. massiliense]SKM80203.1 Uncharacterised protein [Mycobacteroides abscessus subsp. massiliense]
MTEVSDTATKAVRVLQVLDEQGLQSVATSTPTYFVFLIAIPFSASDQSIGDRGLLALMLLWMTPLTLAGGWYLTLPVILLIGGVFMYAWPRLPSRVTGWRPRGFWQNAAIYPFLLYGLVSAALLILAMFVSIPASCMSGRTG